MNDKQKKGKNMKNLVKNNNLQLKIIVLNTNQLQL